MQKEGRRVIASIDFGVSTSKQCVYYNAACWSQSDLEALSSKNDEVHLNRSAPLNLIFILLTHFVCASVGEDAEILPPHRLSTPCLALPSSILTPHLLLLQSTASVWDGGGRKGGELK